MEVRLKEIRQALKNKLYYCALALALTLPDICGKHAFPNESVGIRYKKWFDQYAKDIFTSETIVLPGDSTEKYVWFTSEECFALRCAYLHAGNYELERVKLEKVSLHVHFRDGKEFKHMIRDDIFADWDVITICNNLCEAAEKYCADNNINDMLIDEIRIDDW